ncbi:MAG: sigma 54-interacting transcriptional regulator [Synergistaceae bacterium]|nr:sigma 54-interacting transcriptional regulator [Synergistaceae bacterium]
MCKEDDAFTIQESEMMKPELLNEVRLAYRVIDSMVTDSYDNLESDIMAIFSSNYDVIYSSNASGITQKVSGACEELWGLKPSSLIGRSVFDLEREGVYQPSVTRMVLEAEQRRQTFQTTKTGRRLMVLGTPIKNKDGKTIRIINLSRDISSETGMKAEMENIRHLFNAYSQQSLGARSPNTWSNHQFIYTSNAMARVARMALKVSDVDSTVLITGESGVGKEIIASFIHANSRRSGKPFIKVNCGAIPESLLESELFGYEKGAFTGANKEGKPGMFELAHNGTLLLDEISEISKNMQVKMLRALQERTIMRIGGTKQVSVNVKIIAASNKDLEREMFEGRFRQDLFYRLNIVPIHIPALRERPEDVPSLTMFFLNRFNEQHNKNKAIDSEAIKRFQEQRWHGNIRELQNVVERLVVLTDKDLITEADLPPEFFEGNMENDITVNRIMPLKEALIRVEQQLMRMAAEKYGTTTKIAEALGVDQSTISRKLRKV